MARLLVVEDDDVQQHILKSALENKGHVVDGASDGLAALRKLRSGHYDLVLLDYRIPEVDGLASAKILHETMDNGVRPKIVAITANSSELEARVGADGVFDAIVPKPFNLNDILALVDRELKSGVVAIRAAAAESTWRQHGLARAPAAYIVPDPIPSQLELLQSLFDVSGARIPDVIAIVHESGWSEIVNLRENSDLFLCPVVDLTGHFDGIADGCLPNFDPDRIAALAATLRRFAERRRQLSLAYVNANDIEHRLLAYLFLSGQTLHPVRYAQSKDCVRYVGFFSAPEAGRIAVRLDKRGLLSKAFVDRIHVCSRCESARLNAREECPECRSSHLREEAVIHHFRCACQAPEGEFISGRDLVCPKCRQHLRHYGSDYDKPGRVHVCADCGHKSTEAAIGFVCYDCGSHVDGDVVARRDIYSYRLTEEGLRVLTKRSVVLPDSGTDQSFLAADCAPAIAEITYAAKARLVEEHGKSGFEKLREMFIENLRTALSDSAVFYSRDDRDFLLAHAGLEDVTTALLERCQRPLPQALGASLQPLDRPSRNGVHERSAVGS